MSLKPPLRLRPTHAIGGTPTFLTNDLKANDRRQLPTSLRPPALLSVFQHPINRGSPNAEFAGDRRGAENKFLEPFDLGNIDAGFASPVDTPRFGRRYTLQLPSRRRLVSNSANTPNMSRNALPAAVPVSTGYSVARSVTPLAFSSWTIS